MGLESHATKVLKETKVILTEEDKRKIPEDSYKWHCGELFITRPRFAEAIQKVLNGSQEFGFAHIIIKFGKYKC